MFLVSNEEMIVAACESGITGAIPALNYRTNEELRRAIRSIRSKTKHPFGINLIVNSSNIRYADQLEICLEEKIDFLITSLGSPAETIKKAHAQDILVFCDVTTVEYAQKVEKLGADALIAVNSAAGGHAGEFDQKTLLHLLQKHCSLPVISAGGVGNAAGVESTLQLGAAGLSIGSIFIATKESPVTDEYKQAIIDYGKKDIVLTTRLSGTPCTVINTPFVQEMGTEQGWLEKFFNRNKKLKKWVKALTFLKGMKMLQKAAFGNTYQNVWCAGPSIEYVKAIRSIPEIVSELTAGLPPKHANNEPR